MNETWRPLRDRLIVKRQEEDRATPGGIIIPDAAKEKPARGEVLAVGYGRVLDDGRTLPLEVRTGDRILFAKYAGTEVKLNGEDVVLLSEDDVLAVAGRA